MLVLDARPWPGGGLPSTLVEVTPEHAVRIIHPGALGRADFARHGYSVEGVVQKICLRLAASQHQECGGLKFVLNLGRIANELNIYRYEIQCVVFFCDDEDGRFEFGPYFAS